MTLGDLRKELEKIGIRQVGALRIKFDDDPRPVSTIVFSADEKIVVPFALKTAYHLAVRSLEDNTKINSEKYKSLMRAIERDRNKSNS